jgi:glycosyltransferase involved in cell wall biosynthesis
VLSWWNRVHRELGLELVVTSRRVSTVRHDDPVSETPGVRRTFDPTDDELASLYANALCLLWPSLGEGYGLPLLEAMAVGTPFISTDVGAASELAVRSPQIQPLVADRWMDQIRDWTTTDLEPVRRACVERARPFSWAASAEATLRSLAQVASA